MAVEATATTHEELSFYEESGNKYSGLLSWLFSTDHKRIGLMYLAGQLSFFSVAALIGVLMRLELIAPGRQLMGPQMYNACFTVHGVIMIFLFIVPGLPACFGNFLLPLQIGAKDVAFPKLNLLSWWLYMIGAVTAVVSLFTMGGPPDTGWTFYVPYAMRTNTNVTMAILGAFILGFSSILTGINFVTTVHRLRAPGMTWRRLPLFVWSLYATGWVQILATPVLGITLLLVMLERVFGVGIFDPAKGGDPILYQHLFWIYSHPAVYVMILPAMGAITEIIPVFARRTVFGYMAIAMSSMAIAGLGSLVWGHHMFVSGQSDLAGIVFSFLTFVVAIPSAIKVFNWVSTLYKGSIHPEPPLMFALMFIFLFMIGGFTGLMNGALSVDVQIHDTAFVVGHFHYVMFGGTGIAFFAAVHYWFPKMFGRMYNRKLAYVAMATIFVGFNTLYFPMLVMGWLGMPRRYYDYLPRFHPYHLTSTIGSWILVAGLIVMAYNLIRSMKHGEKAEANPWGAATLEWQTSSPPPLENFHEIPRVDSGPYDFRRLEGAG
ncbi:MAG: cytochrome c oxidase subunit I [Armatimonadetes bacterium CG_4_10_14_3_um_filter_66_18]|nr:cytochrome c oxidase subunit I [Armatimonadota bacterium]OIP12631.1 MAG: cytochrome c oxidase subunit I [Armatimonadetes bacterium CG2_30_66_41]PIU88997.1 MAG: cytochrome c oxidase subunit I [Armatimonadetes bacterium CG06_land_8_20_14_3_00_66_21]PIW19295.1 MAG: cytochrome c oxidase subunit I [Armatimonadetes bacterium CG17_big_fil_post_rev_8_21_14_2_50_66_6]PIX37846.1 MAG: cytochrome c oxidase subunit I [Armatimonadetes bacterium CG_4_8_14_3_um_filter_66_20]PIY48919.1 MAG: cytochrome c oxi